MYTVIITGGTGLIGTALSRALVDKGYHVIILTRNPPSRKMDGKIRYAAWNTEEMTIDREALREADFIIHLAGAGVADRRWTKKRKQEIISSRVDSSRLIVDSLDTLPNKVKAVVSASGIGWYGEDRHNPDPSPRGGKRGGVRKFIESDPPAHDFLGTVCRHWEESIEPVLLTGARLVKFRIGIVLSHKGGALKEFLKPLRFRLATVLGKGKQIVSWIHIDDLVSMLIRALGDETMQGVYNAVAPNPVSNKELIIELARSGKRFYIPVHVPSFILKWLLGEMSVEVLKSTSVSCEKIQQAGFDFQFPDIRKALATV